MLMGALIGGIVGLVFYFVKNAQDKKKQEQNDSVIDDGMNEKK